ncbi:Trk system potassium transporter TrkA [Thermosulfurimonas dismutans]|nr:Trk system potassium transporter TrkA [Thermosulfurimonas dismutans]
MKRILIVGAGEVGYHLAERLSAEGHQVVIIETNTQKIKRLEKLNILAVKGSGASAKTLEEAGIREADLFIAVTNSDEINLISCLLAREYGVPRKIARVKSEEYLSPESPLNEEKLGLDLIVNPVRALAEEIVRLSRFSQLSDWEEFGGGQILLIGYQVRPKTALAGVKISDLMELRKLYAFLIVAIVRKGKTIIPRGDTILRPQDRVFLILKKKDLKAIEHLLGIKLAPPKKVFVIGGGKVGKLVAEQLEKEVEEVVVVETDLERCELLSESLSRALVLNVDGLEAQELIKEGLDRADLVISVTNSDTVNILSALLAKHYGAQRVIIRVDHPDFIPLLNPLGIDKTLSSRLVTSDQILRFVKSSRIFSVTSFLETMVEVEEIEVPPKRTFEEGVKIRELDLPEDTIVGALYRNGEVLIPSGETVIKSGDLLVIIGLRKGLSKVEKIFEL